MSDLAVIKNCSYCLAHVPDLVRYGSKPRRQINQDPSVAQSMAPLLRSYEDAVCYPPNQTYIGNLSPEELAAIPRPWFESRTTVSKPKGPFGEILDQETFFALLKAADVLNPPLFKVRQVFTERLQQRLAGHPLLCSLVIGADESGSDIKGGLPLFCGPEQYATFYGDQRADARNDPNLMSADLLEALCTKASGALAIKWLLERQGMGPDKVDYVISCGEEACGDRYQRGGGGMAKAMAAMSGCSRASGMDIKNFCAAPASALITAAALVQAGVFENVVVVGGGSLAKLGMKLMSFLEQRMVILDDCLAAAAFLVCKDDGRSPVIRISKGAVGSVPVSASSSDESVFRHYLLKPLENLGLTCRDIDRFAPELQNPEIMEFAGSGDVARKNYRKIAAMAVLAGQLPKEEMNEWIKSVGMVGFAPTQGHIPSAIPYIGHAMLAMQAGEIRRAMFMARASLFLNRCTDLLDGVSFILERNPASS